MSDVKRYDIEGSGLRTASGDPVPSSVVDERDFDALDQRCRELESQHGSARMVLDLQISMLRDERDAIEGERDALRAAITAARDKLGPAVRHGHPALIQQAAEDVLTMLEAACAATDGDALNRI